MERIYEVEGKLNCEFVGQIAYSITLEGIYDELIIDFAYEKERFSDNNQSITGMKTELQLTVMMNDKFVGTIHRGENPKHIKLSQDDSTPGFIPQPNYQGNVRIIIIVFSVIIDETTYKLQLFAGD